MKEIQLTQGKVALVDDDDYEALAAMKWYALRDRRTFYAVRNIRRSGGGRTQEKMHRLVLGWKLRRPITKGMECDHDNGDGLDNRREKVRDRLRVARSEGSTADVRALSEALRGVKARLATMKPKTTQGGSDAR